MRSVGTKLRVIVPIQVSEDAAWEPGTAVQVVRASPNPQNQVEAFGEHSYEIQAADGSVGSFSDSFMEDYFVPLDPIAIVQYMPNDGRMAFWEEPAHSSLSLTPVPGKDKVWRLEFQRSTGEMLSEDVLAFSIRDCLGSQPPESQYLKKLGKDI